MTSALLIETSLKELTAGTVTNLGCADELPLLSRADVLR